MGEVLKYLLRRLEQSKGKGKGRIGTPKQYDNEPTAGRAKTAAIAPDAIVLPTEVVVTPEVQQRIDKLFREHSKMTPIGRADVDKWELAMLSFTKDELLQLLQAENVPVLAVGTAHAIIQELKIGKCDTLNRIKERLFGKGQSR